VLVLVFNPVPSVVAVVFVVVVVVSADAVSFPSLLQATKPIAADTAKKLKIFFFMIKINLFQLYLTQK
jgi:hypothetical protein